MNTEPLTVDFDGLEVGTRVLTRARTITETDLVSFSALTGDWHPQHADADRAAASPFGERIAHGMLVLSYGVGLLPIDPDRVVALRGLRNAVFKRPVPIGSTISVEAEIASLKPLDPGHGLVELALRVRDGAGKLVARASLEALWRRAPSETSSANGAQAASANGSSAEPAASSAATAELSPCADGRVLV
jgi:3-hydroxybutyryl-CoA dehydratase